MTKHSVEVLLRSWTARTPRRAVLGVLAATPLALALVDDAEAKDKKPRKKKHFCLNGQNVNAKQKKKKRRLRSQGATRGKCTGCTPQCDGVACGGSDGCGGVCGCATSSLCVSGACKACTTPCAGTPANCGAELTAALLTGGDIYLCPGTYTGTFEVNLDGTNLFGAGSGTSASANTIVDAEQQGPVFLVGSGVAASFTSLRITNGNDAGGFGGGIYGDSGAGLITVDTCVVTENDSPGQNGSGGLTSYGPIAVVNSEFTNNSTGYYGGAVSLFGSQATPVSTISNSTFTGNYAFYVGGALYAGDQDVEISGSTISGNSATDAGAIYLSGSVNASLTFDSASSVINNTATGGGTNIGGIFNAGSTVVTLNDATVENNIPVNCSNVPGC